MAALDITGSPPVAAVVTLSLDSPLVEHLRRSGAKNPDALLRKLEKQEFDTFEELLNFKSEPHYDMLLPGTSQEKVAAAIQGEGLALV